MFNPSSKVQGQVEIKKKGRKNWRLFHATDFQSLIYPCFAICRILGLYPYKINGSSFKTSKPYYFLSIIIMCAYCISAVITMTEMSTWFYSDSIEMINRIIEFNSFYVLSSFIMVVTYVLKGPQVHLLQTISKNSLRIPSKMYKKQSIIIHYKDVFGFLFLIIYSSYYYYNMPVSVALKLSSTYISAVSYQMNMMYVNCVCVLKTYFKKINDDLANLPIMDDKRHLVKWIYHEQRNSFSLIELRALRKQYSMVSDSVQMLNIMFSPQLLATIAMTIIQTTIEVYFGVVQWQNNGLFIRWTKKMDIFVYMACYILQIGLSIWICETGKNEAVKIRTTIHDVLNSTSDEQIKHELQLFSLQILHHNNTFSAKGFTMDATLIVTMTSTIATYLIILVQFLVMTHSCDEKIAINVTQAA